ncbi:TatD family hydrolase [Colwellia sp. 1_MG-2023]|uniref:TatD family hydrolase n=1 Tax=Colwellia sp. 1_MG-2023 TaxID=3062649 RepID=UPI0026E2C153|nr:TatD family hydrolase [Colwellia sp. 1_MG-2023]MDO6446317.1 TatD family hydrolase [Colwellia sp. 1_MG-2023]
MKYFTDSHCHIDFPAFDENRQQILSQCYDANIHKIIIPAVSPSTWQSALNLAKSNQSSCQLFPCLGIHPWYLNGLTQDHLVQLDETIASNRQQLIAIGETGLDGVIAKEQNNLALQQYFFEFHLEMANKYDLPTIIHHRRTHQETVKQLKLTPVKKAGIIHAFSGSYQQGKAYIDLGFKLGIGGTITYPRAEKTIKAVKRFPVDALVLETDAPAMPLFGMQGKNNSPLNLLIIFDKLAEIRDESKQQLAESIENNIRELFKC